MYPNTLHRSYVATLLALAAALLLSACSSEDDVDVETAVAVEVEEPAPTVAESAPRRSSTTNAPQMEELPAGDGSGRHRFVPDVQGQLDEAGAGLAGVIDGTDPATFRDSLAWIAADTSSEQYAELEQAIRFLNAYDPAVLGNDENMRLRLDGLTGQEVIDLAAEVSQARSGMRGN
ncbi:MAG: hypothetical protein AAGH65_09635 [Pseudomonadota bacterium]